MDLVIPTNIKLYEVKKVALNDIEISGLGKSNAWQMANPLTDFSYPWNDGTPPLTTFKALWDAKHLFFNFTVEDECIITNNSEADQNSQIIESDRVELFFKSDEKLIQPYYCLEMDSASRILSSKTRYYRQHEYSFKWPGDNPVFVKTSLTNNGYIVEGAIKIEALKSLNLLNSNILQTGIYRGNFIKVGSKFEPRWISWINPNSEKPDFHFPSSFGLMKLVE